MVINAERLESRIHKPKATVLAFFAAGALIAGCSSTSTTSAKKVATTTEAAPTTGPAGPYSVPSTTSPNTSPSLTEPYDPLLYEINPNRIARINKALNAFGLVVLQQATSSNSVWGQFDGYCSSMLGAYEETGGGWLSQGYKPAAGQVCEIENQTTHAPIEIVTYVVVGNNENFTNQFVGATIVDFANKCWVGITEPPKNVNNQEYNMPVVSFSKGGSYLDVGAATSLAQAESIDAQAIACLNKTRP